MADLWSFATPLPALCACRVGRTGRAGDKEGVAVTLLLEGVNRDTHFAGLLVNSLTLGGQEVPRSLYALAMKVRRLLTYLLYMLHQSKSGNPN
jgi:superfamily II DNA/RNA helicase